MKNSKKIIKLTGYILFVTLITSTTISLPFVLTNVFKKHQKIKNFFSTFNNTYKELEMFAKSLDYAYNFQDNQYENKAKLINESMRNFIQNLANTDSFINNENSKPTVLFIKNDQLVFNNDENSKLKVNQFWCEQPILFPQIYSKSNDSENPGLNFFFPAPINNNSNALFDDWFEIGASSFESAYDKFSISQRIVSSWNGTCDYVFYLYDSNNIYNEPAFLNYIYKTKDSNLWATKLLKTNAKCKNIIPLDMQWFYYGNWDQIGVFIMLYLFANIIINPSICIEINLNQWDKINWNESIDEITNSCSWTPLKLNNINNSNNNLVELPKINNNSKSNYLATLYNLVGHSFSLGIKPNYIMKFNKNNNNLKYNNLAGYQSWYLDDYNFNFIDQNNLSSISSIKSLNLYALSANRDILSNNAIWPIPDSNTPELLHDTTPSEIGNIISQLNIKPIFSERNDTSYTQSQNLNRIIYDTANNKIYTVDQWINEND